MSSQINPHPIHECGGTILDNDAGAGWYRYCDTCRAFTYDAAGPMPSGTDRAANRAAWDDGEDESPSASDAGANLDLTIKSDSWIANRVADAFNNDGGLWRRADGIYLVDVLDAAKVRGAELVDGGHVSAFADGSGIWTSDIGWDVVVSDEDGVWHSIDRHGLPTGVDYGKER